MAGNVKVVLKSVWDDKGIKQATAGINGISKGIATSFKAVAAATAAVTGIAAISVKAFASFDAKLNQSLAIMGNVSDAMRTDMSNAAREVAKTTTFSADQAAESFYFLASAGLDAASSIEAMPQVAKFAQAGMFDMASATDLLTDAQSALGMVIKNDANKNLAEMTRLSDVLVRANTLANASVEQFSTSLTNKAGASLRQFGKDAEEGVAVLAALADQGIKGELAGTSLSIAMRDLTSKALSNKKAFAENNVAVFDGAGKMRNMADIVSDLEGATTGMSDAQKKATFTQLGFSDKSMGTIAALLGTSDAIRNYEKELRSSTGFTDKVAGKQLETFSSQFQLLQSNMTDIALTLGEALMPVMSDVVNQIKDKLLPLFQQLGDWLKSPAGIKAVADLGQAFSDGIQNIIDFTKFVIDNWDAIKKVATAMVIAAGTFYAFTTAVNISTAAVKLFNTEIRANLWTLAAIAVAAIATGMWLVYDAAKKTAPAVQEVNTAILESENAFVTSATNGSSAFKGLIPNLKYTGNALDKVRIASEANTAEFNRFNNLNLSNARNEMAKTANATNALGNQIAANNRQLYYAMHPELVDPSKPTTTTTTTTTPIYSGPSQAQQVASAIKDANKAIASATKKYSGAVSSAKESYKKAVSSASDAYKKATESADIARGKALIQANTENANAIISINQNAASKLASIVAESVNRLRDAFKSAVATNVADIFATDEVGQSVDNLVTNLRDRLAASKALLAKSASLSSAGFSQTFIEQVVGAGLTAGNELANAVLEATPQTQKELQGLYAALEIESNTGMDTLSQTIYDGAGLATDALKQMYADTLTEQTQALADQAAAYATAQAEIQSQFETAMTDAALTRDTALADAMTVYKDALIAAAKDFKDSLDEIETQFKDKIAELGKLKQSLQNDINALQGLIDQKQKLAGIAAQTGTVVNTTPKVNIKSPVVTGNTNATVINVNVKTDSTQSTAQVGKTIAKAVQKYTGTGSGLNKTFAI